MTGSIKIDETQEVFHKALEAAEREIEKLHERRRAIIKETKTILSKVEVLEEVVRAHRKLIYGSEASQLTNSGSGLETTPSLDASHSTSSGDEASPQMLGAVEIARLGVDILTELGPMRAGEVYEEVKVRGYFSGAKKPVQALGNALQTHAPKGLLRIDQGLFSVTAKKTEESGRNGKIESGDDKARLRPSPEYASESNRRRKVDRERIDRDRRRFPS